MTDQVKDAGELDGNKKEDWMNAKWRPMMGWMYMLVCTCDFVIFPVLWSIFHAIIHSGNVTQWSPLTLQGAGLFHMAMGAIIGVAAFGRTQEKLAGANNGGAAPAFGAPSFGSPTPAPSFGSPAPAPAFGGSVNNGTGTGFGGTGFGSTPATPVQSSFGSAPSTPAVTASGKKIIPQDDQPLL